MLNRLYLDNRTLWLTIGFLHVLFLFYPHHSYSCMSRFLHMNTGNGVVSLNSVVCAGGLGVWLN